VRYEASKTSAKALNALNATIISSPGDGWTSNNNDAAFDSARTGADSSYTYGKAVYETSYTDEHTNLTFTGLFRGQMSNEKLMSSEQAAISGPGSVRGFSDNSIRRDNAFIGTLEVASPYIPVIDELLSGVFRDRLQGFVFYDYGHGSNIKESGDSINLDSAGVGTRFGLGHNLSGTVEYGREMHDELNDGHDQKVNFRLNAAY
jgi:hemolysin activation/secretion protein